jgi:TolB-like protein
MRNLGAGLLAKDAAAGAKREVAAAILNLDPTHEEACCHLMRAHAEQGDVAGALRIYKALWNLLDRDYGMEPSLATEKLVAQIKLGVFEQPLAAADDAADTRALRALNGSVLPAAPQAVANVKAAAKTCLVLLPFAMHGVDSDHTHLVQGFHQHLAASLVRFREWSVVDRHPAIRFREWSVVDRHPSTAALPATDSILQYSIETTAYQAGAEINMVMVLRDEAMGIYVWSETFRLGLNNWFEAQQRIIRRIAMSLNVQLSAERLMRLAGEPDVSLDTHDRWLRGQSLLSKFDAESWQRAVTIFRDAIRENPTFSPCYSSLVQMNNIEHIVHPGFFRDLAKARATVELAKTAVQLDPVDSRAHLCCGWSYVMALRETEAAPHMELACELNEQARLRAEQSLALSPAPSYLEWGYHATVRALCGDYAGALEAIDRAHGVIKTLPAWRAVALFHLGEVAMAKEQAQRFLNGIRSFWIGPDPPTDEAITRWLLQAHPISIRSRWEALRHTLRGVGLPVEGIVHLA